MYGVLYAYTPEVFPAPHRGTGVGLASTFCRICNTMVPIIACKSKPHLTMPLFNDRGLIEECQRSLICAQVCLCGSVVPCCS